MMPTAIAVTRDRVLGEFRMDSVGTKGSFITGGAADAGGAGGACLNCAPSSAIAGRRPGSRLKHRSTVSTNSGARFAGRETLSERSRDHAGGVCVRASTSVMPSPHMSPAVDILPLFASGAPYDEGLAVLAVRFPAGPVLVRARVHSSF